MSNKAQRSASADEAEIVIKKHSSMLFRICLVLLGDKYDAEDALQEAFWRYLRKAPQFHDQEHEKAWLIKVATNLCRDMRRFRWRCIPVTIDDIAEHAGVVDDRHTEILALVMNLPQKHKEVILLYYVEGYGVKDIAGLLGISVSATKKRLQYARQKLKLEIEREAIE